MNLEVDRKRKHVDTAESSQAESITVDVHMPLSSDTSVSEFIATTDEDSTSNCESEHVRRPVSLMRSKHWKWYSPKNKQRLYHVIFTKSNSLDDVASQWVQLLEDQEDEAMICLLQFFVDVTGYPEYSINSTNVKEIVGYMGTEISRVIHDHGYIFLFDTTWYKQAQATIFAFIQELLKQERVTFNTDKITHIISFFKAMSQSNNQVVKHAGVVFALKFAVNCANFLKTVRRNLKIVQQDFITSHENVVKSEKQMHVFAKKRDTLSEYLKDLFAIILKNYGCNNRCLVTMRVMCAEDIYSLLRALPDLFFRELQCIPILIGLLSDQNKKVRASSVKTLKKLFLTDKYKEYTDISIAEILNALHDAMYDVDLSIAALAINVITCILKIYPYAIPQETRRIIFCTVYSKNYKLGTAAGNFLATFLRIHWAKTSEAELIEKFVQFQHTSEKLDLIPTAVDSVIESMPELHSYATILNILVNRNLQFKYTITLLDVLRHTVSQIITGKSEQERPGHKQAVADNDKLNNIRKNLIPNLIILFELYKERESQEILLSISLTCFSTNILCASHHEFVKKILIIMQKDFFACTSRTTLDMISRFYKQMNDDLNPLKSLATAEAECCMLKVIETFHSLVNNNNFNDDSTTNEEIDLLKITYLRLVILYQHFDLSARSFAWNMDLLENVRITSDNILLLHIECGVYKLVWQLRWLLDEDRSFSQLFADIEEINVFKIHCLEYLQFCFSYWDQSQSVQAKVFWSVCDLLLKFYVELKELVKLKPELQNLYFALESEQQRCMIHFLKEHVLDVSVPDHFGCQYLGKFLEIARANLNPIPIDMMVPVFSYYFSLYEKYQKLFDSVLNFLAKVQGTMLENFILKVLVKEYRNLENKEDFKSTESCNLGKLAEMFSLYLSRCHRLFELLYLGLELQVYKENFPFLRYLRYFVDPLKQADKKKILEVSREALGDYESNEHIIFFMKYVEKSCSKK